MEPAGKFNGGSNDYEASEAPMHEYSAGEYRVGSKLRSTARRGLFCPQGCRVGVKVRKDSM